MIFGLRVLARVLILVHLAECDYIRVYNCLSNEKCVRLSACRIMMGVLAQIPRMTSDQGTYLARRQCGLDQSASSHIRKVYICCPKPGYDLPKCNTRGQNQPDSRITGGSQATANEFPWMAMLIYKRPQIGYMRSLCGGSLINNRYVVTAAHCVAPPQLIELGGVLSAVRLGNWNFSGSVGLEIGIEQKIIHSGFKDYPKPPNDVALLRLQQPVRFTAAIKPICIDTPTGYYSSNSWEDKTFQIAGWGKTEHQQNVPILRKTTLKGRNLELCQDRYTTGIFHETQICAGGLDGKDTCNGDSGGPLMFTVHGFNQYVYLAGITSYGPTPCGFRGWPAVFSRTAVFLNWIKNNIRA